MRTVLTDVNKVKNFNKKTIYSKYSFVFIIILFLTLISELFIFNFKWINSVFDEPIENGVFTVENEHTLKFKNINTKVKYVRFDPGAGKIANITISAIDEANINGLTAPQYTVLGDIKRSQYIRLNFSGKITSLSIVLDNELNGIALDNITINTKVPLMFSLQRFIILLLILMFIYVVRPGSELYKYKTNLNDRNQQLIATMLIVVQAVAMFGMIHWNKQAIEWHKYYDHHRQYYELIDSFKNGRLYVSEDNGTLSKMGNPYDKGERDRLGADARWDHAFRNGKYYIYFGAVPAVLMYLPYNFITGKDLPNYIAIYILCLFTMIGIMFLLWEIIKKWFNDTPFLIFLIVSVIFGAVSLFGYAVYKPDLYLVPNTSALMFCVFGLALWLSAKNDTGFINYRLTLGSLCVALTAGCRPQMTLTFVLGIVLFWDDAFGKRLLFSRKGIKSTVAVCLPFVVVAAILMWYNAARFGSPFDFGANYNLTTNDMTHRGFVWGRICLGLFSYLFQPVKIDAVFPFLADFSVKTAYQGRTLTEMMIGGVFSIFPILLFSLYGAFKRTVFRNKLSYRFVFVSLFMAVFIVIIDTQMAGLLTRYFTDFVWLLMLSASITIFALFEKNKDNAKQVTNVFVILSVVSLVLVFLRIFAHSEDSIMNANPLLYYNIQRLVAFWM